MRTKARHPTTTHICKLKSVEKKTESLSVLLRTLAAYSRNNANLSVHPNKYFQRPMNRGFSMFHISRVRRKHCQGILRSRFKLLRKDSTRNECRTAKVLGQTLPLFLITNLDATEEDCAYVVLDFDIVPKVLFDLLLQGFAVAHDPSSGRTRVHLDLCWGGCCHLGKFCSSLQINVFFFFF